MTKNLQSLNREIINRSAKGKTIWQPRICCWFDDRVFRGEELPDKYKGCDHKGIYEKIGCSDRLYNFNECLEATLDDSIKLTVTEINNLRYETTIQTPVGTVNSIFARNTQNPGVMPIKWFIEEEKDLLVYSYIEEGTTYKFNNEKYDELNREMGHLGLPAMFIPRVNLQKLYIELSGVINSTYLLNDSQEAVENYFKALSKSQEKMVKVIANSPLEWINYGDNIHSKLSPPSLFEKYILPEYELRGDLLHRAGKFVYSHWDGDVKELLPYAKSCFLDGIEAITPIPQGDVTLKEVKAALGDDIFLIDGIASILFNETYPLSELEKQTKEVLNLFEGQLILGISDEFPSDGKLNRIEFVNNIVDEFNSIR